MDDLSHSTFPPGGWQFRQPQTNWTAPAPIANTFDQQVTNIIKHRLANPAITAKHKLATDFGSVSLELDRFTRTRLGIPMTPTGPKLMPPPHAPQAAGAVAAVKRMAAGAATIVDWLTSGGGAVSSAISSKRAEVCVSGNGGKPCPKHIAAGPSSWFTEPVAALIKKELSRRADLKLSTPSDDKLRICGVCNCEMRLKVHAPWDIIQKHLKADVRAELWAKCWQLTDVT